MDLRLWYFRTRRRTRRILFFVLCSSLILAMALLAFPFRTGGSRSIPSTQDVNVSEKEREANCGSTSEPPGKGRDSEIRWKVLWKDENIPYYLVELPDPDPGKAPAGLKAVDGGVCGNWALSLEGDLLGLKNCHLYLLPDGRIVAPSQYESVFTLDGGHYEMCPDGNFTSVMAVGIKIGGSVDEVPVIIHMKGRRFHGDVIEGDFEAEPQGEAYRFYCQKGKFRMIKRD